MPAPKWEVSAVKGRWKRDEDVSCEGGDNVNSVKELKYLFLLRRCLSVGGGGEEETCAGLVRYGLCVEHH